MPKHENFPCKEKTTRKTFPPCNGPNISSDAAFSDMLRITSKSLGGCSDWLTLCGFKSPVCQKCCDITRRGSPPVRFIQAKV